MTKAEAASLPATEASGIADLPLIAARLLDRVRDERPNVHAITNAAAQVLTANLLLAVGAVPSLTIAPDEIESFVERAGALLVNLGTLDTDRRQSIERALRTANDRGKPWVLDPVFVDASPARLDFARACLIKRPPIIRCNEAEFTALSAKEPSTPSLAAYAAAARSVVALTGMRDRIADGRRVVAIANGDPQMTRVTALGCAATALVAAFAAIEPDPLTAAAAGLLVIGVAGEIAGETASGPGSFLPAFLDALYGLSAEVLQARADVS